MKKGKRLGYLGLTTVEFPNGGNAALCSFCRYAEFTGFCKEPECECQHPILERSFRFEDMTESAFYEGGDCWGFRPDMSIETAADVVGIWAQGKEPDWATVPFYKNREAAIGV